MFANKNQPMHNFSITINVTEYDYTSSLRISEI